MNSWTQPIRKDEKWAEVSLGRCCGRRMIGIDFSAVRTLISYWPSFLPSKSTHLSIDRALALLYGCFNKAHWRASFYCLCPCNSVDPSGPSGQVGITCRIMAPCNTMRCGGFNSNGFKPNPVNGRMHGFATLSELWAQVWSSRAKSLESCQFAVWMWGWEVVFSWGKPDGLYGNDGVPHL